MVGLLLPAVQKAHESGRKSDSDSETLVFTTKDEVQAYELNKVFVKSWSTSGDADDRPTGDATDEDAAIMQALEEAPLVIPGDDFSDATQFAFDVDVAG
jgi:hypothetical protein